MTKTLVITLIALATAMALPFSASATRDDFSAKWGVLRDKTESGSYTPSVNNSPRWGALLDQDSRGNTAAVYRGPRWAAVDAAPAPWTPAVDNRPRWGALLNKAEAVVEAEPESEVDTDLVATTEGTAAK